MKKTFALFTLAILSVAFVGCAENNTLRTPTVPQTNTEGTIGTPLTDPPRDNTTTSGFSNPGAGGLSGNVGPDMSDVGTSGTSGMGDS